MLTKLVACTTVLSAVVAQGAAFAPITFSTSADYTNNFNSTTASPMFSYDDTTHVLDYNTTSAQLSGTAVVNYTPRADFLTETLSYDTSFSGFNSSSPSSGIVTRLQSSGAAAGTGILALVNEVSSTSLRLRLFSGAAASPTSTGVSASFYDNTFTIDTLAAGSTLHVTLTQTDAADPVFNLTVSNGSGTLATTGDQAFTANDNYNTAGGIALRGSSSVTPFTITFDNLAATAVPEPATMSLLAVGGLALLRRRRA